MTPWNVGRSTGQHHSKVSQKSFLRDVLSFKFQVLSNGLFTVHCSPLTVPKSQIPNPCLLFTAHCLLNTTRGPLPACNDTFFSFRVSRAGIFNGLSARDTGPLRIPLGRLGAAASPTDKPRKYGALPPVIPKRHHYTLALLREGGGMFFETPKTPADSDHCSANPLGGKNYSARRKRTSAQARPM
jgi:hypothetical protein